MTTFQARQRVSYTDTDCGEPFQRPATVVKVAEPMTTGTIPVLIRLAGSGRSIWVPITRLSSISDGAS
jgi:hypothetical protein